MPEAISQYFLNLYKSDPSWNFIFFYDSAQLDRVIEGFWMTVELSIICVLFSVIIGIVGAWMQTQKNPILRIILFFSDR